MSLYYSTFVPGLSRPVEHALTGTLQCKVHLVLDGLIAYEANVDAAAVKALPFVTNTFLVFKSFPSNVTRTVREIALQVLNDSRLSVKPVPLPAKRLTTFRIIISRANQLVSIDDNIMRALEQRITKQTGLRPNRSKPDYEFWLLQRTEGQGFFSVRMSRHKAYDKLLQKGELRPELAYMLCWLSEPYAGELFLDPFCGSGAIPIQRAHFPTGLIIASDNHQQKVDLLKQRIKDLGLKRKIVVRCDNALTLSRYETGSVHKIVTDPPWGHFEDLKVPIADFYDQMAAECCRILTPGGRLVLVTAQTDTFEASVRRMGSKLKLFNKYGILLSGKKAAVYVLKKI